MFRAFVSGIARLWNSEIIGIGRCLKCTQLSKPAGKPEYRVSEGDTIYIEKLGAQADETVTFDKVIAVSSDNGMKVGTPVVDGATVTARVIKNGKQKKITVFTYKPKKDSHRKIGHRQPYTKVQIEAIHA